MVKNVPNGSTSEVPPVLLPQLLSDPMDAVPLEILNGFGIRAGDMFGTTSADRLFGTDATNRIYAGDGNDELDGKGGDDTLVGGRGKDTLTGGTGKDTFVFADANDVDVVKDFNAADDHIDIVVGGRGTVAKAFDFIAGKSSVQLQGSAPTVIYDKDSGGLWFDADGKGIGGKVQKLRRLRISPCWKRSI